MSVDAKNGIDVEYLDGTEEHVDCTSWWTGDGALHTDGQMGPGQTPLTYEFGPGPSFPLSSLRKWQATR